MACGRADASGRLVSSRAGLLIGLLVPWGPLCGWRGGAVYLARLSRARATSEPEAPPPRVLSLLEQALALLEDAARADGAEDRRRALGARRRGGAGRARRSDLARSARMLAWSEREPVAEETTGLAQRVRSELELEESGEHEEDGRAV